MGKGAGGLGIIIAIVAALLLGGNVLGGGSGDSGFSPGSGLQPAPPAGQGSTPEKGDDTVFEFTKFVSKDAQDVWAQIFTSAGKQYPRAPGGDAFTGGADRLRAGVRGDGAVLLPGRQQGVSRPVVLPGAVAALRCARRLRHGRT